MILVIIDDLVDIPVLLFGFSKPRAFLYGPQRRGKIHRYNTFGLIHDARLHLLRVFRIS